MTPNIKPFLVEADRRRPDLRITNTTHAAFDLLQLTLALAGPEWAHVGKTNMDGSQIAPFGFTPFEVELTRNDGQRERVRVTGVSQDAAWHVPTHQQIKVIAFSAANDPGPWEHGPAQLTPYPIDPAHYRWHNPPVPQFGQVAVPWTPSQPPSQPAPPASAMPSYEALGGDEGAKKITRVLGHDYRAAGRSGLDDECGGWLRRTDYDVLSGQIPTVEASVVVHRDEWLTVLGLITTRPGMMSDTDICGICGATVGYERGKRKPIPHAADCTTR